MKRWYLMEHEGTIGRLARSVRARGVMLPVIRPDKPGTVRVSS